MNSVSRSGRPPRGSGIGCWSGAGRDPCPRLADSQPVPMSWTKASKNKRTPAGHHPPLAQSELEKACWNHPGRFSLSAALRWASPHHRNKCEHAIPPLPRRPLSSSPSCKSRRPPANTHFDRSTLRNTFGVGAPAGIYLPVRPYSRALALRYVQQKLRHRASACQPCWFQRRGSGWERTLGIRFLKLCGVGSVSAPAGSERLVRDDTPANALGLAHAPPEPAVLGSTSLH